MKPRNKILIIALSALVVGGVTVSIILVCRGGNRPEADTASVSEQEGKQPTIDLRYECANKPVKGKIKLKAGKEDIPETPESINVYELRFPLDTVEKMNQLTEKLGIDTGVQLYSTIDGSPVKYYAREGDLSFNYFVETGKWLFRVGTKVTGENPDLPSEEECKEIAIQKIGDLGLLPKEYTITRVGGDIRETRCDGKTVGFFLHRAVYISPIVDGYKVYGPGMVLTVYLGTRGELIGITSTMKDIVPVGEYPVKTLEEAISDAEDGNGTLNLHAEVKDPAVSRVMIQYYASPADPENKYLVPVYVLSGPETCIYVPMIKEDAGRITDEKT